MELVSLYANLFHNTDTARDTAYKAIMTEYGVDRTTAKNAFYSVLYNAEGVRLGSLLKGLDYKTVLWDSDIRDFGDRARKDIQWMANVIYLGIIEKGRLTTES